MDVTAIILTYNRPNILQNCLHTLFNNTEEKYNEVYFCDDGSEFSLQRSILDTARELSLNYAPTHTFFAGRNRGVGYNFETAFNIMRMSESNGVFAFVEADYVWRKGYLEDVKAVFEASPQTIAIAGVDHPDMVIREKTHGEFVKLMVDQFGEDLAAREHLYNEFYIPTVRGAIKVRSVSNSCGCQFIHWGRLKYRLERMGLTQEYWEKHMARAFHKNGTGDRRYASDAHMSGTLSMYAEKWMKQPGSGIDISKDFGMLSISDFSISQHICGQGINGMIVPEGSTFVNSPTWDDKYLTEDPRKSLTV